MQPLVAPRQMRPEVARDALLATHGGLSLEWCAVICNLSPMALYRLVCAFGHHSLVTVLSRCGLPIPVYFLADEKHTHCLTNKAYLPTIVSGRVIWHLGYTEEASATALTESYRVFHHFDGARTPVQLHTVSTASQACGAVWGGSRRRASPHIGLDAQPTDSHFWRLSMSTESLHH